MITKLLIANRGEIACRIMRTAREMGVATVAVYSDADAKALHTRSADEAVHIGASPAAESYLVGAKIIAAAKETGADAVHPGYGFLSENADFAQQVIDAGLIWVGPKPESIRAMGLKDAAKTRMIAAGVPVTPGYLGADQSVERLSAEADAIGYPVLIKAVAGGGGKGMRKVDAPENFAADLDSCRREAKASFSNDEILLEKWITSPRHIEVQVFGDSHGNVVHLFERDCSLQRRHQKVIEEAPAPGMDEATRAEICAAAVRAAKAVDYEGAGTIEFIADASEGLRADRIFFMEMNTRLQVEHPVTEEITGVDLVEWQLRVASGEAIPLAQEELSINGHAIEARLYAEDPAKGFLPSTGRIDHLITATPMEDYWTFRYDFGYDFEDTVTPNYDPMIGKIIAKGEDRDDAISQLLTALERVEIYPLKTNLPFLIRAADHEDFRLAKLDTAFVERHLAALTQFETPLREMAISVADDIAFEIQELSRLDTPADRLLQETIGFRLNNESRNRVLVEDDRGNTYDIDLDNDTQTEVAYRGAGPYPAQVLHRGELVQFKHYEPRGTGTASAADGAIIAPMPGKVIAVDVTDGQTVKAGERLMVLEAMKMEHALTAPFDGTVTELAASEGGQVQVDAVLCVVEPTA